MTTSNEKLLIELIKVALGKSSEYILPDTLDWDTLFRLSMKQCVPAIVLDGLNHSLTLGNIRNSKSQKNCKTSKLKWFGMVLNMEKQYAKHESTIADLATFYMENGFRMMLLKGYNLSKYWPIPNHRPTGDIDIFLMDVVSPEKRGNSATWKRADRILKDKLSIETDNSHHHHSVFTYKGIMVENHFDFVNVHSHQSNQWIEKVFKDLAVSEYESYTLYNGVDILFPSPLFNCLFIARHNAIHFAAEHLNFRQLLDWLLFIERRNEDIDWNRFWNISKTMGMDKFVLCMVFIAVEHLSFKESLFHIPDEYAKFKTSEQNLIYNVLDDILHPTDNNSNGKGFTYIKKRYKLWKRNLWKHKIVYSDSIVSTFFVQLKSHLMKPSTIFGT